MLPPITTTIGTMSMYYRIRLAYPYAHYYFRPHFNQYNMKNLPKKLLSITALSVLAISACHKKKDDSVKTNLIGSWRLYGVAYDTNYNWQVDPGEYYDLSGDTTMAIRFILKADGTGIYEDSLQPDPYNFTWQLINNNSDVTMVDPQNGYIGYRHIKSISATDFISLDTMLINGTITTGQFSYYKKVY